MEGQSRALIVGLTLGLLGVSYRGQLSGRKRVVIKMGWSLCRESFQFSHKEELE